MRATNSVPSAWKMRASGQNEIEVPLVGVTAETLQERLGALVDAGPEEWRRVGGASRAYVERVHDIERVVDALVELYEGQALAPEVIEFMRGCGFSLACVYGTVSDALGRAVQADLLFKRG